MNFIDNRKRRASIGLSIIIIEILIIIGILIGFFIYSKQNNVKPVSTHHYQTVMRKNERAQSKHLHHVHGTSYVHPITILYTNPMISLKDTPKRVIADNDAMAIDSAKQYIKTTENRNKYKTYITPVHVTTAFSQTYVRVTEVNAVFIKKNQSK